MDDSTESRLIVLIVAATDRLSTPPPTRPRHRRGVPLGQDSRSRRDGYWPDARSHVERYLQREVLGLPVQSLARASGLSRSTVYASIDRGRRLVAMNRSRASDLRAIITHDSR